MADMSKVKIPCDNGPYRDGKGTIYEGGTRVAALANWPGHIPAGATVNGMIHVVDWYPTLARLAGASTAKCKPLDGLDVWPTISEGKPSPRTEVVYNIEPFRGAVRQGDWKLVWRTMLPQTRRTLQHRPGSIREEQPRRATSGQGRRACRSAPTNSPPRRPSRCCWRRDSGS